jgi:hypothetical protein
MTTLHLENTLHDYDSWKSVFDKFDRVRADHGVRSYRIRRHADDPLQVVVDLEFDDRATAEAFAGILAKVRATPQSRGELVSYVEPVLLEDVEDRVLTAAGAPPSGPR